MEKYESETVKVKTFCGEFYITLAYKNGALDRTFFDTKDLLSCQRMLLQVISRLVSLCIQNKISKRKIIDELKNQRCNNGSMPGGSLSCPDAFAKILEEKWK